VIKKKSPTEYPDPVIADSGSRLGNAEKRVKKRTLREEGFKTKNALCLPLVYGGSPGYRGGGGRRRLGSVLLPGGGF